MTDFATKGSKQSYKEFDNLKVNETLEITKTPVNDTDAVNKEYVDNTYANYDGGDSSETTLINIDGGNSTNN